MSLSFTYDQMSYFTFRSSTCQMSVLRLFFMKTIHCCDKDQIHHLLIAAHTHSTTARQM